MVIYVEIKLGWFVYRVFIKSHYSSKVITQTQLMRYLNQIFFYTHYEQLIEFLITIHLLISGTILMKELLLLVYYLIFLINNRLKKLNF